MHILTNMEILYILWLLFHKTSAYSVKESFWYKRENSADVNKLRRLWTKDGIVRVSRCAVLCQEDTQCISFFYGQNTTTCQGHSIVLGNLTKPAGHSHAVYFIERNGEGYIGDLCTSNAACITSNAECRNDACWCKPGYSFFPSERTCKSSCVSYGREYTVVQGYFIHGNNADSFSSVTLEECARRCAEASDFLCKTFEYGTSTQSCALQAVTYLEMAEEWYSHPLYADWSHYQRDCE